MPYTPECFAPPLDHLVHTRETKWALQLWTYATMCERAGLPISSCWIVLFDSTGGRGPRVIPVPPMRDEAEALLGEPDGTGGSLEDRDARIAFDPVEHTYTVDGATVLTSVTTAIAALAPAFDADVALGLMRGGRKWNPDHAMWGKSDEEIKAAWAETGRQASAAGTALHAAIEQYYKTGVVPDGALPAGYADFASYDATHDHVPIRIEKPLFSGLLAGTPDMIFRTAAGENIIVDWKYSRRPATESNFGRRVSPV